MLCGLITPILPAPGALSAQPWEVCVSEAASDERCCVATKLSDDGEAGAERHIKIAGALRMLSLR